MPNLTSTETNPTLTLIGCGDLGQRLAGQMPDDYRIVGLRRRAARHPRIDFRQADLSDPETLRTALPDHSQLLVITLTPDQRSDDGYRRAYVQNLANLLAVLAGQPAPQRVVMASSTRVYPQRQGEWVDEDSPTAGVEFASRRLLESEQLLRDSGLPHTIVRFSGIYGPGRNRLLQQVREGRAPAPDKAGSDSYSNRIHADDCAGVLAHLLLHPQPEALYLASDCQPVLQSAARVWLAERMGCDPSPWQPVTAIGEPGGKRCDNRRLLASGYHFRYPDYRAGYGALLADLEAKGGA